VTPPEPLVNVPLFVKLPLSVNRFEPGVKVASLLIVSAPLICKALPNEVVPEVTTKLLKVVKIVAGRVLVAVNSTVPVLGVQVVPVPPIASEPVLKVEEALMVRTAGELLEFPSVKLPLSKVDPLTNVMVPVLLALLLSPPNVTAPLTVNLGFPDPRKVNTPAVLEELVFPPMLKEAQVNVPFTVTVKFPVILTLSTGLGGPSDVL
jgi:hypothetical protein